MPCELNHTGRASSVTEVVRRASARAPTRIWVGHSRCRRGVRGIPLPGIVRPLTEIGRLSEFRQSFKSCQGSDSAAGGIPRTQYSSPKPGHAIGVHRRSCGRLRLLLETREGRDFERAYRLGYYCDPGDFCEQPLLRVYRGCRGRRERNQRHTAPKKATAAQHCVDLRPNR
jgi:hypothetical protein